MAILIVCVWMVAIVTAGCDSQTRPSSNALQVAGTYDITQTGVEDTCGMGNASVSFVGTVAQAAGASGFTLTDTVGTRFSGTVDQDGNFSATATQGPDSGGQTYSERLEGRFTTSGFSATLRVDVTPRNCFFTRNWTAAKR